ncbi:MAG: 3-isopropylmalate dehydratase small subunit [Lachnospiraceae bacterium]|nr:3-isopropylmalate dehydratase small subunit [Lachnospiraceae bacterium]
MEKARGTVHKYGDNVDTDVIIPARYLNTADPKELASHCMEDIDREFVNKVHSGDIMVADKNFGCGSSREHAPIAIKESGIACVIAETFARIFYRNSINIGLAIIECPEAVREISDGDTVSVDFDSGMITDETTGKSWKGQSFPPFMQKIIDCGGLIGYINHEAD